MDDDDNNTSPESFHPPPFQDSNSFPSTSLVVKMIFIATDKITNYQATGRYSLGAGGGGAKVGKALWRGRSKSRLLPDPPAADGGGGGGGLCFSILNVAKLEMQQLPTVPCFHRRQASLFTTAAPC